MKRHQSPNNSFTTVAAADASTTISSWFSPLILSFHLVQPQVRVTTLRRYRNIYNFIHHQTMIANNEKKQQLEIIKN